MGRVYYNLGSEWEVTVLISPYHGMAAYGTLCLNNAWDESFFIGMKGRLLSASLPSLSSDQFAVIL